MKIRSSFVTGAISKLLDSKIKKKFGYDVNLDIHAIRIVIVDGKIQAHVDLDCSADQEILTKLL